MNKLILIKTNVNMKQIESIKVVERYYQTIKTVSACQIYLRDNEEFYKLCLMFMIKIGHFQEIRFL